MENKDTFKKKVQSMTAKQIIMAMVNGLKKPAVKVDMGTYGRSIGDTCFGCAATNTVCKISGKVFDSYSITLQDRRVEFLNTDYFFLDRFESAIDDLRSGCIVGYNKSAKLIGISLIKNKSKINLPILNDKYTKDELQKYIDLANSQH